MTLPEWRVERGIGESRFALIEDGEIVEARILRDGIVPAGSILEARLTKAGRPALAAVSGTEYLLPKGAAGVIEGATLAIEVTRESLGGAEDWKRPLAKVADGNAVAALPPAIDASSGEMDDAGWQDLISDARDGIVAFPGGELRVFLTPAMTLIDVDGTLPTAKLAQASAKAAARAIRRHGIAGSIGIDFPTVAGKAERQAIADAFDTALPQPFERTAVNGFGFMQIVRPRRHASLFELAADRPTFEALNLLRTASSSVGQTRLRAHPAVLGAIQPEWVDALAARVGGEVSLHPDPTLAMWQAYAE
ncbi:hypothetical protein [Sphingomonas jaspsi]|uniref:hypothetical protein n=1 Tax=Sphingomonas jaspsi TaxID=392409 RepID=UPI0006856F91|nr:hypothetical protein [Sphingomonas jaspsi]